MTYYGRWPGRGSDGKNGWGLEESGEQILISVENTA